MGSVPGPAGALVGAVTLAVDLAADAADPVGYRNAVALLTSRPAAGRILGDLLRLLLEDAHPDGFASEDVTLVVGRCYRTAATWLPAERVDVTVLFSVLAGALGVDDEPDAAPTWSALAWHAPLLVADLLPFAPASLEHYVQTAFAEYDREAREEPP
jgi:hypothetical protein